MRYVVGIDLGTTNSCVAYIDTEKSPHAIHPFSVPQLKEASRIENYATLPSFCYLASPQEWPPKSLQLPWKSASSYFVGQFAMTYGGKVPTRLVQSAKSWLCHSAASRRDNILPVDAAEDSIRISPVEASARYLIHLRDAWNHQMSAGNPDLELQQQEIILTVPASFDEVARALTVEAAKQAGFNNLTLLEEPQAAFYSWISCHEKKWGDSIQDNSVILVCDVGGGTTDFSLIEAKRKEEKWDFQRMAVGDHLLLGGDNMDRTVAHFLVAKAQQNGLSECSSSQWLQLYQEARKAKETLLSTGEEIYRVILQGKGSSVIQGSFTVEITRDEILHLLKEGFFPVKSWEEALLLKKGGGIRTMGLPYEEEPSILNHMAVFLNKADRIPDYVLFNGGTMKPAAFQEAVFKALNLWFPEKNVKTLESMSLDLSVSRGAAYYGKARRGEGIKIGGGAARGYYLGIMVEGQEKALTLLPRGSEEGTVFEPNQTFWVTPNSPVSFKLYSSHTRLQDESGTFVDIVPEEFHPLPLIQTVLRFGKGTASEVSKDKIAATIGIQMTPIGTLELWIASKKTPHRWTLEFQLRNVEGQENSVGLIEKGRKDETFDKSDLEAPKRLISSLFEGKIKSNKIVEELELSLGYPRQEWAPSILRACWGELVEQAGKRKASQELEARWWNLAGFFLRPGLGYPLDDFRLKELWKIILGDLKAIRSIEAQIQSWICFRRIAAGLNKGQQIQLANELWSFKQEKRDIKDKNEFYQYQEKIRTLASFERLEENFKVKLGNSILARMKKGSPTPAEFWALARLGSRQLFYGNIGAVVSPEIAADWIHQILAMKEADEEQKLFVLGQLAKKTDHREINLPDQVLEKISAYFNHSAEIKALLFEHKNLTKMQQEKIYGDSLPLGISLYHTNPNL